MPGSSREDRSCARKKPGGLILCQEVAGRIGLVPGSSWEDRSCVRK